MLELNTRSVRLNLVDFKSFSSRGSTHNQLSLSLNPSYYLSWSSKVPFKNVSPLATLSICNHCWCVQKQHPLPVSPRVNLGLKLQLNHLCTRKTLPIMSFKLGLVFLFIAFTMFHLCPSVNTCFQISSLSIKLVLKYFSLIFISSNSFHLIVRNIRKCKNNKYQVDGVALRQRKERILP